MEASPNILTILPLRTSGARPVHVPILARKVEERDPTIAFRLLIVIIESKSGSNKYTRPGLEGTIERVLRDDILQTIHTSNHER